MYMKIKLSFAIDPIHKDIVVGDGKHNGIMFSLPLKFLTEVKAFVEAINKKEYAKINWSLSLIHI